MLLVPSRIWLQTSSTQLLRCLLIDFCLHPSSSLIIPSHGFSYISIQRHVIYSETTFFFSVLLLLSVFIQNSLFSPFMHPLKQINFLALGLRNEEENGYNLSRHIWHDNNHTFRKVTICFM